MNQGFRRALLVLGAFGCASCWLPVYWPSDLGSYKVSFSVLAASITLLYASSFGQVAGGLGRYSGAFAGLGTAAGTHFAFLVLSHPVWLDILSELIASPVALSLRMMGWDLAPRSGSLYWISWQGETIPLRLDAAKTAWVPTIALGIGFALHRTLTGACPKARWVWLPVLGAAFVVVRLHEFLSIT